MTQTFASGKINYLATKLTPGGVVNVTLNPGITSGRYYLKNDNQIEWFDFTGVTPNGSYFTLTGVTRDLDPVAIPVVSNSTGKTWLATQTCVLVAMHDQLFDKNNDNTFQGNIYFSKSIQVPVFDDATERDATITSPDNGMLCYITDVQDYYSYKNGIWVKGLGGSGGAVTWYQDSTDDGTLVGVINGVNVTYELSHTPAQPQGVILTYNGQVLEYGASDDYTISGTTITMNFAPVSGKLVAFYPDVPTGTNNAETRVTSSADAHNGELFRNSGDSENLYYKDNGGNVLDIGNKFSVTGEIKIWSTDIAPTGYLICEGQAISRVTYADLFSVLGTTYGVGDGSTTFNLPNLKGRVVVGYNSSEAEFNNLGKTGGEKTHKLTIAEMPSHNHRAVSPDSPVGGPYSGGVYGYGQTTGNTGGDQPHNNLQPYITLNYIIKY